MKKRHYNDRLDADAQISAEEEIAVRIFDEANGKIHEEDCADLGRDILYMVLRAFRPDLLED